MLSRYKILGSLGAGGMGVVYRADDLTLKRPVALKVLTRALHENEHARARFLREARVAASLNHANVCVIHDFGEVQPGEEQAFGAGERIPAGAPFIAMELVEGETLAQRIARKPLPVQETVDICVQIAEGLEAAHERGIVHRDLKPANVKITPDGRVKILDFGLAKPFHHEHAPADATVSQTFTDQLTRPGVVVGTVAYMSPEQVQGNPVDRRTDVWAFGCVLYECLTGKRAFRGDTVTDTLAKILVAEPDWSLLPADTPAFLKAVLHRCLRKDPKRRFHDVADARIEITDVPTAPEDRERRGGIASSYRLGWVAIVAVVALGAGTLIGILVQQPSRPPAATSVVRTAVPLPPGMQLTRDRRGPTRAEVALAPDGSYIVFSASPDGSESRAMLYRRPLDRAEATPIPGTEGARTPFFSPDGRWIGFWAKGSLSKLAATGGIPNPLCEADGVPYGVSWSPNGGILFGTQGTGVQRVSADGGKPETLTRIDTSKESAHRLPHLLPGGKAVVFTVTPHWRGATAWIEVMSLETGQRKVLVEDGADARYLGTGHLVFVRRGALIAAPFDLARLQVTGPAVTVATSLMQALNEVDSRYNSCAGQYDISESGTLIYATGGIYPDPQHRYYWVDRSGQSEPWTAFGDRPALGGRVSPDGRNVAFYTTGLDTHLWIHDISRGTATRLTSDGLASGPVWTPDGKKVAFPWSNAGPWSIWWKPWDGSGTMEQLTKTQFTLCPSSWTPDGEFLALVEVNPSLGGDILVLRLEDRQVIRFAAGDSDEAWPEFSPDGRWLAFASNESAPGRAEAGRFEIYLRSFPGGDKRLTISNQGGIAPLWAPDGRELFYWTPDSTKLMKVDISLGQDLSASTPMVLFEFPALYNYPSRSYDITPDGRRFLIQERVKYDVTEVTQLNLVQNWFAEVERLCPTSRN